MPAILSQILKSQLKGGKAGTYIRKDGKLVYKILTDREEAWNRGVVADRQVRALNLFQQEHPNHRIVHTYSKGSRVIKGSANLLGVKLENGLIGWLDLKTGHFSRGKNFQYLLHDLDDVYNYKDKQLEATWEALTPDQQARVMEEFREDTSKDFHALFDEYYSDEEGISETESLYDDFIQRFERASGVKVIEG